MSSPHVQQAEALNQLNHDTLDPSAQLNHDTLDPPASVAVRPDGLRRDSPKEACTGAGTGTSTGDGTCTGTGSSSSGSGTSTGEACGVEARSSSVSTAEEAGNTSSSSNGDSPLSVSQPQSADAVVDAVVVTSDGPDLSLGSKALPALASPCDGQRAEQGAKLATTKE